MITDTFSQISSGSVRDQGLVGWCRSSRLEPASQPRHDQPRFVKV
jgi:hypothetical protein